MAKKTSKKSDNEDTNVLLIDQNPAVQALTGAALGKAGIVVVSLAEGKNALKTALALKPKLALCAHDLSDCNPYELCKQLKSEASLSGIKFVLLVPETAKEKVRSKAQLAQIDEILGKPFKSEGLRKLVESLLSSESGTAPGKPLAIMVEDTLLCKTLVKFLKGKGVPLVTFSDGKSINDATKKSTFSACIAQFSDEKGFEWYNAKKLGALFYIGNPGNGKAHAGLPEGTAIVERPLSVSKLDNALANFLPDDEESDGPEPLPLESGEQSLLAARISAAVYERLLTYEGLKNRKWDEACSAINNEALRICRDYK